MTAIPSPTRTRALSRARFPLLFLVCACLALAAPAPGQSPRLGGDAYTDETNFGFRVHVPDGWVFVPPSPDDGNAIAKHAPKSAGSVVLSARDGKSMQLLSWILKFDRRPVAKAQAGEIARRQTSVADVPAWVAETHGPGFRETSRKKLEVGKIPATELVFTKAESEYEVGVYAMLYELAPDVDVAVAYIAPAGPGKWGKYEAEFKKLARTFKPVALKAGKEVAAAGDSLRDRKRALLQKEIANQGDWRLYETENYFIVSNNDDEDFIADLKERLEAIRTVFEKDYPAARVDEIRASAARTGAPPPRAGETAVKSSAKPAAPDPREMSRTSVVRVCKNREQYMSYGAPPNSGGFWYSVTEELVLFDDKENSGRARTWGTLFHEAFHQYIYYFYGNIAPHSWYNEGTGDFYSGYAYRNKRFTLEKPEERHETVREAVRSGKFVPLVELVRMSQKEYYSDSKYGSKIGTHYAQGWALIYFLRTGKKNGAKGWNPRWDTILDTYLTALASSGKIEQAVEQAFAGVDFDELQAAWIEYTL